MITTSLRTQIRSLSLLTLLFSLTVLFSGSLEARTGTLLNNNGNTSQPTTLKISSRVFHNRYLPFKPFIKPGPYGKALMMNINYSPVKELYTQIKRVMGYSHFTTRGEAHITVITPPEYNKILKSHVSIYEINILARRYAIQKSKFKINCLGNGKKIINAKKEETFFIVVDSPDLLKLRTKIRDYFVEKGGDPDAFKPGNFYPHITVGFTKRDLHASDGVYKNRRSCDPRFNLKVSQ